MLPFVALLLQVTAGTGLIPAKLAKISPLHPPNAVAGTRPGGRARRCRKVEDKDFTGPFNDSSTCNQTMAVQSGEPEWTYGIAGEVIRPPAGNTGFGGPSLGYKQPTPSKNNHPPYHAITDPGYPQTATTEASLSSTFRSTSGNPLTMLTVQDIPQLTDLTSCRRIRKFMPAMESGKPSSEC
jgi:hypothetical protein